MRLLRTLLTALATLIVAGTIASAAPGVRGDVEPEPTPEATVTTAPEPSETPSPEPVTSETIPPEGETEGEGISAAAAQGFAACEGLTGLENAICRHEALLAGGSEELTLSHPGLQNSLNHLVANLAAQTGEATEEPVEGETETEGEITEGTSSCPGKSCEPHGNGKGHTG